MRWRECVLSVPVRQGQHACRAEGEEGVVPPRNPGRPCALYYPFTNLSAHTGRKLLSSSTNVCVLSGKMRRQYVPQLPEGALEITGSAGYWVTSDGRVFSTRHGQPILLRTTVNNLGYQKISLPVVSGRKLFSVHRLVALAFVPNPEGKPEVNHKDLDKLNNRADNFEWMTHAENLAHARANRVWKKSDRKNCPLVKLVAFPLWPEKKEQAIEFDSFRAAAVSLGKKLPTFSPVIYRAMKHQWRAYGYFWRKA